MKKVICLTALVAFLTNANAQHHTVKKTTRDFNGIEISSAAKVKLIPSDSNYVELSSKDSIKKEPVMEVQGGVLEISSPFKGKINVYAKNITSIKVSDAAKVTCKDTFNTDNLTVEVSDAGSADILVHAKTIKVRVNDAGSVTLSGSAYFFDAKASDASKINSNNLRATSVSAASSNGSNISVRADSSVSASSAGGSSIDISGKPKQKSLTSTDGSCVSTSDSGKGKKVKVTFAPFIGGGFVTGGSNGTDVKYGASREFIVGFNKHYDIAKWNALGWSIYYKSTDFYLQQNANKTFPESILYQSEKISTQNFGASIFDQFNIGKNLFISGGVYGDWAFHSKHIIWDNNTLDGSTNEIKTVNLSYVNPFDYGLTFRLGIGGDVVFYCNYRLSKMFQNNMSSGLPYPTLPAFVFGVVLQ